MTTTASASTQTSPAVSAINWFEIPVLDLDRAERFYQTLLGQPLRREAMGPQATLSVLPYSEPGTGGALFFDGGRTRPVDQGVVIYLNGGANLDQALQRLEAAGGRTVSPRVDLPDGVGSFVHFMDCEGNRLGLHAAA